MAKATNTTIRPVDAKPETGMSKAGRRFVDASAGLIKLYATTPTGPASAGMLDAMRKHVAAFVERDVLKEPPLEDKAAQATWEKEAARLDDIEIAALHAILGFTPTNACDLECKLEYVRKYSETTGNDVFAYEGAYDALCDSLIAARRSGVIEGSIAASSPRVWIGALVCLDEVDDQTDPAHFGGDHVVLGINGAGIQVDGSPRWYPVSRVTDVLPDFTIGIDDQRNEADDATLLRLLARMRSHQTRASELEPEAMRTHKLWEEACVSAGVWHDVAAYQKLSEADRKAYQAKRPEREAQSKKLGEETGHTGASRVWQAEYTQSYFLQRAIRSMPVNTLTGLKAKAEATKHWHYEGCALLDESEGVDAQDRSLIMLIRDIGNIDQPRSAEPALPDLTKMSYPQLYTVYETFSAMRNLLDPLETLEGGRQGIPGYREFVEHWTSVVFNVAGRVGDYAATSGRADLSILRARYIVDVAEGELDVVGEGVPDDLRQHRPRVADDLGAGLDRKAA